MRVPDSVHHVCTGGGLGGQKVLDDLELGFTRQLELLCKSIGPEPKFSTSTVNH